MFTDSNSSTVEVVASVNTTKTTTTYGWGRERELTRPIRNIPPLRAHSALPTWRFVKLSLVPKNRHIQSFPLFIKNSLFINKDTPRPSHQDICHTFTFQEKYPSRLSSCYLYIFKHKSASRPILYFKRRDKLVLDLAVAIFISCILRPSKGHNIHITHAPKLLSIKKATFKECALSLA